MKSIVVCDTNLLVSASLFPNSKPDQAFQLALLEHNIVSSIETLAELFEVLTRTKFDKYVSIETRLRFFEAYRERTLLIDITHSVHDCRDPKDNKFLNLILSGSASFLVTGDSDLLILNPYHSARIVTPTDFLEIGRTPLI